MDFSMRQRTVTRSAIQKVANRIRAPFPLDLIARRPDDTARRYEQGDPLIHEALDHGQTLY